MNYDSFKEQWTSQNYKYDVLLSKFDELTEGKVEKFSSIIVNKQYYKIFYSYTDRISTSYFYDIKKFIINLYKWLYTQGLVNANIIKKIEGLRIGDIVSDDEIKIYFFRDLDDVINSLSKIASLNGYYDDEILLDIKSIAILYWYDIDLEDIINIKKNDLVPINYSIKIANKIVSLDERFYKIIELYANLDTYIDFFTGKIKYNIKSDYLFRSPYKEQLNIATITQLFQKFNIEAKKSSKQFSQKRLKKNGQYVRIYSMEGDPGYDNLIDIIKHVVGHKTCKGYIYEFKKEYDIWKNFIKTEVKNNEIATNYYTGKAVCAEDFSPVFTKGAVYEINNGIYYDNLGKHEFRGQTFEQFLNSKACKFTEIIY